MKNKQPKMINQLHLIYPLIIAVISVVALSSFYYGGGSKAGEMVSFASTLSSIILSVIAIIMTIVDVAGQRTTVSDLKETAEKLENNLIKTNEGIDEVNNLKNELMRSMDVLIKSNFSITNEISNLKEKYTSGNSEDGKGKGEDTNKDIIEDLDNLSEKMKNVYVNAHFRNGRYVPPHYRNIHTDSEEEKEISSKIREKLKHNTIKDVKYEFNEISWIASDLNISRSRFKNELNRLIKLGLIEREDNRFLIFKLK
jgi:low affinity Fe/Cu permease